MINVLLYFLLPDHHIFCFLFLLSYVYLHFHPRQPNIPFPSTFFFFLSPLPPLPSSFALFLRRGYARIPLLIITSFPSSFILPNSFRFNTVFRHFLRNSSRIFLNRLSLNLFIKKDKIKRDVEFENKWRRYY